MNNGRHFLDLDDTQRPVIEALIVRAHAFKKGVADASVRLRGRTIVGMFFEASTRTANSFAIAAQQLGANWLTFDTAASSMSKGETLEDTMRTICAPALLTLASPAPPAWTFTPATNWMSLFREPDE